MSEQDRYIPGVPCWVDTTQPDPDAAIAFYRDLFGWDFEDAMPPGAPGRYAMARIRGGDVAAVSSQMGGAPAPATWNTYVWVERADEAAQRVRDAGGTVLSEPFDVLGSGRMAVLGDLEGAVFSVWEPREHRGATVVNEHASLNFNVLNVRDVERAAGFYGAVFGWELLDVGGSHMWALPGYGDFLERRQPGTLARMRELGAPDRFEDVVAAVAAIADDQPDTHAHWGVTFSVDDADAIASRAVELGGRVLAGPIDAPWQRFAVIADPQGATFTASAFVPENRDLA